MKKLFTSISLLLLFAAFSHAKQVDEATAMKVGKNFLKVSTGIEAFQNGPNLKLIYRSASTALHPMASGKQDVYFYVFNTSNTPGFVIISGDDNVKPVLAYSDEKGFDPYNIPINVSKWLENYKNQIRYTIERNISATKEISAEWQNLKGDSPVGYQSRSKKPKVDPLVLTKWNQSPYYNDLCPYDNTYNERTVTGCVATAMAQIMKYWEYPENGSDFHSYSHSVYGTLSANFGSTKYNWSSMPSEVTSSNTAVATLMYHCGISVDMNYGVAQSGGSGAAGGNLVAGALENYFGYSTALAVKQRSDYTDAGWISLLKQELNAYRPLYYEGTGSASGHAFVCDGYDDNDLFHFNWGWGGLADGYYDVDALNPQSVGTGGGLGSYNSNQKVVIGIEPSTGQVFYELALTKDVTPDAAVVGYGGLIAVSTNIQNYGSNDFEGDYAAALFDNNGVFVDYLTIYDSLALPAGYTYVNDLVFGTSGNFSLLPGTYTVNIFYRPIGGSWVKMEGATTSITDYTTIQIVNPNDIEMNSAMNVSPSPALIKGQAASVNLNIVNNGSATFQGSYVVNLFNLDGTYAQTIGTYNESNGLPAGYTYNSPYLTFSTPAVTVEPGTYLMAVQHNSGQGWQLTGSTNYQNPIKILVKEKPLQADKYEVNDQFFQTYELTANFTNEQAVVSTDSSNCHTGSDYDYYKVVLPPGYDYTITSRLHDLGNSGNGNTYSLDAIFAYSTDGLSWSDAYDDVMPNKITLKDGGTVYFLVSPYFAGATGTYLLSNQISRVSNLSASKEIKSFTVAGMTGPEIIDSANATVEIVVNASTDITNLTPTITISDLASIDPASGMVKDFTNTVTYTVTAQDGSIKVWAVTITMEPSTSVEDHEFVNSIQIYPNPAADLLIIDLDKFEGTLQRTELIDETGRQVLVGQAVNGQRSVQMNLDELCPGTYLLRLTSDKKVMTKKVIVER